ncbi:MAG TPA: hypothetical protein PKY13_00060 [Microthrixaceae bacterium]|jgi:hypothetical protein|nr:hypothetical protein [Microthrixaceae bacterium]HQF94292.1 hypothetical protein [Microthrixaceae bacterium]
MNARTLLAAAAGAVLSVAAVAGLGVAPAGAQTPTLTVSQSVLPAAQATTVTVVGTSYLVPPHSSDKNVFGGVYVMFGWVQPGSTWGPSSRNGANSNGQFGITYSYAGVNRGADTRDDGSGLNRFVAFTQGEVNDGTTAFAMSMDPAFPDNSRGNWTTTITVPGSTYQWVDPATNMTNTVDCLQVQCGIYTIGAHGKASATNERFTPISFSTGAGAPVTIPPNASSNPGGSTGPGQTGAGQTATTAPSVVGGSSTGRTPTTAKKSGPATTSPGSTAPVDTSPVEPTTTMTTETTAAETTTTTTTAVESSTTTRRRSATDETNSASGRVIVFESDDDGGMSGWVVGGAVGVPLVAAGGVVVWRRRAAGV